jgi:CDP-glucose 4,6-dehydratase
LENLVNPSPAFWRGRRVLITGHTGFKGSWLTLWLTSLGAEVDGFALAPTTDPSLYKLACKPRPNEFGDIRNLAALQERLISAQPEIIFHLAAQSLVRPSYTDPVSTYATNVMGTVHLLEAARHTASVKAIVIVTSDKCYENREWYWAYRETEPMGGYDPYSSSKGCAELVTSAYRNSFFENDSESQCRVASVRAGNVIGGGDWSTDRLVPDVIRGFAGGAPVEIRNPKSTRPWQHVLDPLNGYIRLAELLMSDKGSECVGGWNFGPLDEDCRPVSYVADKLAMLWGGDASLIFADDLQRHEAKYLKVDASKAKARLCWASRLRLHDTLCWTVEWYRAQLAGKSAATLTLGQIEDYEGLADVSP